MNKILSISGLVAILSLPAFAEIANNATCNTTNLGQSNNNSTANVEANWNANTININWYNGDTKITSNTCTYDGSITLPTQPTKPGYTFNGWRLRAAPVGPNCSAISNETTCNNTEGCFYNYSYEACRTAIPVESAPYTKCSDITDRDTCLSIAGIIPFVETTDKTNICDWENNSCVLVYNDRWTAVLPSQSWCQEALDANPRDCYWYEYEKTCNCED